MFSKVRFCTGQNLDRKKWMHSVRQCDQDIPICDSVTKTYLFATVIHILEQNITTTFRRSFTGYFLVVQV